jgi:tetratricopeptide (TPR) repeat protein
MIRDQNNPMKNYFSPALFLVLAVPAVLAQQNNAPLPLPAPTPAPVPAPADNSSTKKETENVNAAIVTARAATKDKRYADSEAIMLKVTANNPNLVLPWVELGLAQLGLKKYADAEQSFDKVVQVDPISQKLVHGNDFFQQVDAPGQVAPSATRSSRNAAGGVVSTGEKRTPDVMGVSWASLGEIYIHEGKTAEAQAAFDSAVGANPADAGLYRSNETVFFFQANNTAAQLDAANKAIAADPGRARNYYFKAQALVSQATMDPKTQKMVLPPGCAEAYRKYLSLEPNGQFSGDAKAVLAAAQP